MEQTDHLQIGGPPSPESMDFILPITKKSSVLVLPLRKSNNFQNIAQNIAEESEETFSIQSDSCNNIGKKISLLNPPTVSMAQI